MSITGAFMVPHPPLIVSAVGHGEEKKIQLTINAYTAVAQKIADLKPETIIITSPHTVMYRDYFHISPGDHASGSFDQFGASDVQYNVDYDTELVSEISRRSVQINFPAGTKGEQDKRLDHGTMVPLYFINRFYTNYKLIRIGLSGLPFSDHWQLGQLIIESVLSLNRRVVFVASGDLSHVLLKEGPYGFKKEGPIYDEKIMKTMGSGNFRELLEYDPEFCEAAEQCGHRSFIIMGGALNNDSVKPSRLSYEGPFGVGYGICTYEPVMSNEVPK